MSQTENMSPDCRGHLLKSQLEPDGTPPQQRSQRDSGNRQDRLRSFLCGTSPDIYVGEPNRHNLSFSPIPWGFHPRLQPQRTTFSRRSTRDALNPKPPLPQARTGRHSVAGSRKGPVSCPLVDAKALEGRPVNRGGRKPPEQDAKNMRSPNGAKDPAAPLGLDSVCHSAGG